MSSFFPERWLFLPPQCPLRHRKLPTQPLAWMRESHAGKNPEAVTEDLVVGHKLKESRWSVKSHARAALEQCQHLSHSPASLAAHPAAVTPGAYMGSAAHVDCSVLPLVCVAPIACKLGKGGHSAVQHCLGHSGTK